MAPNAEEKKGKLEEQYSNPIDHSIPTPEPIMVPVKKPMWPNDLHLPKIFSATDYWQYISRPQGIPEEEVTVQSEPEEIIKKLPTLITFASNVQFLNVRAAVFDTLVGEYNWDAKKATEELVNESYIQRYYDAFEKIGGEEETKWVRVWDKIMKDKTKLEDPASVQRKYFSKIQRVWLKDLYKHNPREYFDILKRLNVLMGHIDSTVPKFTDEEMWGVFTQAVRGAFEEHAKENGFLDDQEKFLDYCMKEEEIDMAVSKEFAKDNKEYLASLVGYMHY